MPDTVQDVAIVPMGLSVSCNQEREDRITLRVEARGTPPPPTVVAELEARVARPLGPGVTLAIALVPAIEPEPDGKQRISRSLLGSSYDTVDWTRA
jgi:hypothetical protein